MISFKAAIFDLDGTLIDSYSAWKKSSQKALAAIKHTMTDEEFENMYLMTTDETRQYFLKIYESHKLELSPLINVDSVMDIILYEMENQYSSEVQALPYALDFVKTLYDRDVPMCVATLTPNEMAERTLERIGFLPYLRFVITGDDVGKSKKSPDIFLEAAKRLGVTPSETAVFEDSPTAIKTAYKTGFITCRVEETHRNYNNNEEDLSLYYHWSIKNFQECLQHL